MENKQKNAEIIKTIRENIAALVKKNNEKQAALAELTGNDPANFSRKLNNSGLNFYELDAVAAHFGVSVDYLMGRSQDDTPAINERTIANMLNAMLKRNDLLQIGETVATDYPTIKGYGYYEATALYINNEYINDFCKGYRQLSGAVGSDTVLDTWIKGILNVADTESIQSYADIEKSIIPF